MKRLVFIFLTSIWAYTTVEAQSSPRLRYFLQSPTSPASKIQYGANVNAGHYLETGEARLYYEVYGTGALLVILHGGMVGSTYEMGEFIDSLSNYYKVIAVSTRGHGKSGMGTHSPTYERKAEDVNLILNALKEDSVTVVGFSDGAYTGYFLAALHPGKVKKLVAIGAGEWKTGSRHFNNTRETLFRIDSQYFKQQLKLSPESQRFEEWLTTINKVYNATEVGGTILSSIQCDVLLVAGEHDENAPLETVMTAYKMIPHGQLSIIPNAPHPVFLVNFPAVWTAMKPFLKQ